MNYIKEYVVLVYLWFNDNACFKIIFGSEEVMYINKIHIQNYRNFADFTMEFHKGLNVIIGANNSGKTGLLYAINLLNSPSDISVDDFNKNNLLQYSRLYLETHQALRSNTIFVTGSVKMTPMMKALLDYYHF